MNSERSNPGAEGVQESLVTRGYRDVATERAPASLNEAVLRQAAAATGKGYSGSMRWLRPMAWAATILLSLAVVVQLSDVPQPELDLPSTPASQAMPDHREIQRDTEPEFRQRQDTGLESQRQVIRDSAAVDTDAFLPQDAPLLEEAENLAKMSTGADDGPNDADLASAYSSADSSAAFEKASPCSRDVRKRPVDWLTCIEELEAAGLDETAAEQRRLLAERYPDFDFAK